MLYTVQFLVEAPSLAAAQAARAGATQAITDAGCTIENTLIGRRQSTYQVVGVVCDTGTRWTWRGEADDEDAAEVAALASKPASSIVAFVRSA